MTNTKYIFRRLGKEWVLVDVTDLNLKEGLSLYDLKLLVEKIYSWELPAKDIEQMKKLISMKMN